VFALIAVASFIVSFPKEKPRNWRGDRTTEFPQSINLL
jgi:hypothetical protein